MVALWSPEFACVFQKGTTSRESFDATKSRDFLKKGTTLSLACKWDALSKIRRSPSQVTPPLRRYPGRRWWVVGRTEHRRQSRRVRGGHVSHGPGGFPRGHQPGQAMGHVLAGLVGWGVNQPTGGFHQWGDTSRFLVENPWKFWGYPHFRTSPYGKFEKNMFWVKIPWLSSTKAMIKCLSTRVFF